MHEVITENDEYVWNGIKPAALDELIPQLKVIEGIISRILQQNAKYGRPRHLISKEEAEVLCRNATDQIFILSSHRRIELMFIALAGNTAERYAERLKGPYQDPAANLALLVIKIVFSGEL